MLEPKTPPEKLYNRFITESSANNRFTDIYYWLNNSPVTFWLLSQLEVRDNDGKADRNLSEVLLHSHTHTKKDDIKSNI